MNIELRIRKGTRWTSYNFLLWKSVYRPGENPGRELIANFYSIRDEDLRDEILRDRYLAKAKKTISSRLDCPLAIDQIMSELRKKIEVERTMAELGAEAREKKKRTS